MESFWGNFVTLVFGALGGGGIVKIIEIWAKRRDKQEELELQKDKDHRDDPKYISDHYRLLIEDERKTIREQDKRIARLVALQEIMKRKLEEKELENLQFKAWINEQCLKCQECVGLMPPPKSRPQR